MEQECVLVFVALTFNIWRPPHAPGGHGHGILLLAVHSTDWLWLHDVRTCKAYLI